MEAARDSRAGNRTRELSPYSARRALTARNGSDGDDFGTPPQPARNPRNGSPRIRRGMRRSTSRSRSRDRGAKSNSEALTKGTRRSRSRSQDRTQRERTSDRSKPFDDPPEESTTSRARDSSPEPFKNPPASSKEGRRDRSRDRRRDRSRERRRDRSRDRRGSGSRDRNKDRSRDRSRDRRRKDRSRDRSKDRSRERRRDRSRHRSRDRSREKTRDRSRNRKRKDRDRSRSPLPFRSNERQDRSRSPLHRSKKPLPSQEVSFRGLDDSAQPPSKYGGAPPTKEKPNFKTTGLLAKAANRVEGTKISLKYHEPPEARKPPASQPWRMFVFKGDDVVDTIELHTKSCWLLGRSHEVVDYVLEHPSSSGQHAVVQFRYIQKITEDEFGVKQKKGKVKPYIIDLESSNGTELNGKSIEASRYFELRDKDILKFAGSEREYVVMLPPPE